MKFLLALRIELRKLRAQRATYVGFGVLTALVSLFVWGTWREGPPLKAWSVPEDFIVAGKWAYWAIAPHPRIPSLIRRMSLPPVRADSQTARLCRGASVIDCW